MASMESRSCGIFPPISLILTALVVLNTLFQISCAAENTSLSDCGLTKNQENVILEKFQQMEIRNTRQDKTIAMLEGRVKHLEKLNHLTPNYGRKHQNANAGNVVLESGRKKKPARLLPNSTLGPREKESSSHNVMPSSCRELNNLGHTLSGFYLVKDDKEINFTNKTRTVFCDFEHSGSPSNILEKGIINTNPVVARKDVHFYVQRNTKALSSNGIVRFNKTTLIIGGGMNTTSGVFTAPKSGVYHFNFFGLKKGFDLEQLVVYLRHNSIRVGSCSTSHGATMFPVAIHATLKLKRGDRVDIYKEKGDFNHQEPNSVHFTGSLLEEDK